MRLFIAGGGTGGHLYPGLAIARALVRLRPDVEPFFVGAQRGIERDVLPQTEFEHELLDLHPLYRTRPWENWRTVRGAIGAWRRIGALVRAERPRLVVGTGGYAAALMLAAAVRRRIPIVLQEANSYPGLTTRLFARAAREVYLGYPEAQRHLTRGKRTVLVDAGNPIEPPPAARPNRAAARRAWGFPEGGGLVLLVFGGSQGARTLNETVATWIKAGLPENLFLIWGTGKLHHPEFAHLESERVRVRAYLSPIADAYAASDFAVTRAGAMTTAELCAWGIPPILVPLPTAAADHQTANAKAMEQGHAAIYVPQREFTPERLDKLVRNMLAYPTVLDRLTVAALKRGKPHAADNIAQRVMALLEPDAAPA
jgi:UDP-N-acetylglucosamine--N-acetylmuramyl-(pentapeptide) pyrophosphoryl-undecaprenol N-acetylglucosamine transferase